MTGPPRFPVFRTLAAVLLTAAGVALFPGRADAGCGEPLLTTSGKPPPGYESSDRQPAAPHDPAPRPCHGPGCSNDPSPADVPLSLPTTPGQDDKSGTAEPARPAEGSAGPDSPIPAGADGRPVHRPRSVFHPPPVG